MKDAYHGEFDLEAARQQAKANLPKNHPWHQEGPYAICDFCHPHHSQFIGIDKNLERNAEGEYVLTSRF
jgi:hypothetical protein